MPEDLKLKNGEKLRRGGGHRGGQGGGGSNPLSSPWLGHPSDPEPKPDPTASFIEYLRWMRVPEGAHKDGTKVDIVHRAETNADYGNRLKILNTRMKKLLGMIILLKSLVRGGFEWVEPKGQRVCCCLLLIIWESPTSLVLL